jgi:hypothetical protein
VGEEQGDRLGVRRLFYLACLEAYADGQVNEEENSLLQDLRRVLHIDKGLAKRIATRARRRVGTPGGGAERLDPRRLFSRACQVAWADGCLEKRERTLLKVLAGRLEIPGPEARALLRAARPEGMGATQEDPEASLEEGEIIEADIEPSADDDSVPSPSPTPPGEDPEEKETTSVGPAVPVPEPKLPRSPPPAPPPPPAAPVPRVHYRESGEAPPARVLLLLALGLLTGSIAAVVYGNVCRINSSLKLAAVLPFVFGGFTGWAVSFANRHTRVRHRLLVGLVAGCSAAAADYVAMASWIGARQEFALFPLWPAAMFEQLSELVTTGAWGIQGSVVRGPRLVAVWGLELCAMAGTAAGMAVLLSTDDVFCEDCDRWCVAEKTQHREAPEDPAPLLSELERGGVELLASLPRAAEPSDQVTVDLHACDHCKDTRYLTVRILATTTARDGKARSTRTPVVERLEISIEAYRALHGLD